MQQTETAQCFVMLCGMVEDGAVKSTRAGWGDLGGCHVMRVGAEGPVSAATSMSSRASVSGAVRLVRTLAPPALGKAEGFSISEGLGSIVTCWRDGRNDEAELQTQKFTFPRVDRKLLRRNLALRFAATSFHRVPVGFGQAEGLGGFGHVQPEFLQDLRESDEIREIVGLDQK